MTDEQIVHAREEMRKAITDPKHPWHKGAQLLNDLERYDERGLAFMRKIGPYCFEEDGRVLTASERAEEGSPVPKVTVPHRDDGFSER